MGKTRYIVRTHKTEGRPKSVQAFDTATGSVISNEPVEDVDAAGVDRARRRARKVLDEQRPDWRDRKAYRT